MVRDVLSLAAKGLALAGVAAALYVIPACSSKPGDLKVLAHGAMKDLVVEAHPAPPPPVPFTDAAGQTHRLADFKGKTVVLNIWATYCAPCVEEMPTLARLKAETAGESVAVVPISVDRVADRANAEAFIAQRPPLPFYSEPSFALAYGFQPPVADLPTTLLIDPSGRVRARVKGGADWSGPDALRVVDALAKAG